MSFFEYSQEQLDWLADRDPILGKAMKATGIIKRKIWPDSFLALLHAIMGQQVSSKVQEAIWQRFQTLFAPVYPEKIAALAPEALKVCGISLRKAGYIQGIAQAFAEGRLEREALAAMDDESLAAALTKLPGIGRWTVEMLLIFTFQRQNILSFGDLAIRRGMAMVYGYSKVTREIFNRHFELYSPYASLASLYLWEIAGNRCKLK